MTTRPLVNPAWKSQKLNALTNQRNDQLCGGNESSARSLNAAIATTAAGSTRKPRIATTNARPVTIRIVPDRGILISMLPKLLERPGGKPQHPPRNERQ